MEGTVSDAVIEILLSGGVDAGKHARHAIVDERRAAVRRSMRSAALGARGIAALALLLARRS